MTLVRTGEKELGYKVIYNASILYSTLEPNTSFSQDNT